MEMLLMLSLLITTRKAKEMETKFDPVHPGTLLKEEFMEPFGLSSYSLAAKLNVPRSRLNEIVNGKRSITVDTAVRLSKCFGNSARFWLNLQNRYDLEVIRDDASIRADLEQIETLKVA